MNWLSCGALRKIKRVLKMHQPAERERTAYRGQVLAAAAAATATGARKGRPTLRRELGESSLRLYYMCMYRDRDATTTSGSPF